MSTSQTRHNSSRTDSDLSSDPSSDPSSDSTGRAGHTPSDGSACGAAGEPRWQVRLLGAVEASDGHQLLQRFPSRAVAGLLARLALQPDRAHPREELIEQLWPGVAIATGRNRLRQVLSTLKSLLEPPGAQAAPVLQADRIALRAFPGALDCDARRFERCLRAGDLAQARLLYRGELMPGYYDDWIVDERRRLTQLAEQLNAAVPELPPQAAAQAQPQPQPHQLPAAPALPSGLPGFWTRSVGAELSASRLRVLAGAQRLVTVHGPGGSGKTRLAVEVARSLRDDPPLVLADVHGAPVFDRVAFVPLVDCVDAAQTLDALCRALHAGSAGDAQQRLQAALAGSRALLVLDNCERLDASSLSVIEALLSALPALHLLATSRRLLDADGEHAFELDGLALPAAAAALTEAAGSPAVQLFVDRARAARADFHLSARNVQSVAGLVRLLGGMPLAIELAASRVRALSPAQLLQRLRDDAGTPMLDLLARTSQRTTAGSRHASMRHVVDWSWRQLVPAQGAFLQALTVFAASAPVDAVAAVAGVAPAAAQGLLATLADASLLRVTTAADGTQRYALLQPVREFANALWPADLARAARCRWRRWLADFAAAQLPRGLAAVLAERPQIEAAIATARADGDGPAAVRLALLLRRCWDSDDLPLVTLQVLAALLPTLSDDGTRGELHDVLAQGYSMVGDAAAARRHADRAVALADNDCRLARALTRSAHTAYLSGDFAAEELIKTTERAVDCARRGGDADVLARALYIHAAMHSNLLGDWDAAEAIAPEIDAAAQRSDDPALQWLALMMRATIYGWTGRDDSAQAMMLDCEAMARTQGDWNGVLAAARQRSRVLTRMRRWADAMQALHTAVQIGWQRRYPRGLANALLNVPEALLQVGRPEAAARLHGFAVTHWMRLYGPINVIESAELKRSRRQLRQALGAARSESLRAEGSGLDLAAAVELVLLPAGAWARPPQPATPSP